MRNVYVLPSQSGIVCPGGNLLAQHYEINEGFPIPKTTLMSGVNLFLDYLGIARDGCFSVLANRTRIKESLSQPELAERQADERCYQRRD